MPWSTMLELGAFFAIAFAAASSGAVFKPGAWYQSLAKPRWTPPNWAFPVVWTILFIMIAIAGWRVWNAGGWGEAPALALWVGSLLLNAGWSAIFFGLRRVDTALVEVGALWLSIAAQIAVFASIDAIAAWLMVPYLIWVTIASALNYQIWRMNPAPARTEPHSSQA